MKRLLTSPFTVLVAVMVVVLLVLSGCGAAADGSNSEPDGTSEFSAPNGLSEQTITLRDGRKVTCILYSGYKQGGTSCDWDTANRTAPSRTAASR